MADLVRRVANPAFRRQGFANAEMVARWPVIAGALLARFTLPERVSFPVGESADGTLYIRAEGAFALELQHLAPMVIDRLNTYYGYPAIARLVIRQGPLPVIRRRRPHRPRPLSPQEQETLRQSLAATADAPLRTALMSLGEAVWSEGPEKTEKPGKP